MIRPLAFAALLALAGCGDPAPPAGSGANATQAETKAAAAPLGDPVRIRLETEAGPILLALNHRRAPVTVENFVAYVDQRRFDGTTFYRAARQAGDPRHGFVQGGIRHTARRALPQIAHEPTSRTGIRHLDATISMARNAPGTAMGDFFITVGPMPVMDEGGGRNADNQGFAAFGRVEQGMDAIRRILAAPTVPNAGRGGMRGQMIAAPVRIVSARRAD